MNGGSPGREAPPGGHPLLGSLGEVGRGLFLLAMVAGLTPTLALAADPPIQDCLEGATMDLPTSESEMPPAGPPQS